MKQVNIKVINKSHYELPEYSDPGSSGMDIRANIGGSVLISPGASLIIPTGLKFVIPEGYEFQVRSRSGLSSKKGIIVLNQPGTIDSSFHDELKIILYNSSNIPYSILPGDRIAQLVLAEVPKVTWVPVEGEFSEEDLKDDRGGGFGHTGM